MSDTLVISELAVQCHLGISEEERAVPQPVWIDLEMAIDADAAARRDDVRDTLDYAALVSAVKQCVEGKPYHLLETMAEDAAALVLQRFKTPQVFVRVKKRALPGIGYAAVELTRTR